MTTLYHAAFWLTRSERRTLIVSGTKFTTAFRVCADHCYWADLTRFKLQPKQHMFGELVFELQVQECQNLPSPNPLVYSTQQDEDYVGRICTYSRSVSIRTIHVRTLSRYQIALATLIWFQCPGSLVPVSLPSCWARTASQSPTEMEKLVVSGHLVWSNMKSQLIRLFCGGSGDFLMEYDGILLFWYVLIHPLQYLSQNWITQTWLNKTQNRSDQNFGHFGKWPKLRAPGFPGTTICFFPYCPIATEKIAKLRVEVFKATRSAKGSQEMQNTPKKIHSKYTRKTQAKKCTFFKGFRSNVRHVSRLSGFHEYGKEHAKGTQRW